MRLPPHPQSEDGFATLLLLEPVVPHVCSFLHWECVSLGQCERNISSFVQFIIYHPADQGGLTDRRPVHDTAIHQRAKKTHFRFQIKPILVQAVYDMCFVACSPCQWTGGKG